MGWKLRILYYLSKKLRFNRTDSVPAHGARTIVKLWYVRDVWYPIHKI